MKKPFSQISMKHFNNGVMQANVRFFKKEKKDVPNKKKIIRKSTSCGQAEKSNNSICKLNQSEFKWMDCE